MIIIHAIVWVLLRVTYTDTKLMSHCSYASFFVQLGLGFLIILIACFEAGVVAYMLYQITFSNLPDGFTILSWEGLQKTSIVVVASTGYGVMVLIFDGAVLLAKGAGAKFSRLAHIVLLALLMHKMVMLYVLSPDIKQAISSIYLERVLDAKSGIREANSNYQANNASLNSKLSRLQGELTDLNQTYRDLVYNKGYSIKSYEAKVVEGKIFDKKREIASTKAQLDNAVGAYQRDLSIAKDEFAEKEESVRKINSFLNQWSGMAYLEANEPDEYRRKSIKDISRMLLGFSILLNILPMLVKYITRNTGYNKALSAMLESELETTIAKKGLNSYILKNIAHPKEGSEAIVADAEMRRRKLNEHSDNVISDFRGEEFGNGINRINQ